MWPALPSISSSIRLLFDPFKMYSRACCSDYIAAFDTKTPLKYGMHLKQVAIALNLQNSLVVESAFLMSNFGHHQGAWLLASNYVVRPPRIQVHTQQICGLQKSRNGESNHSNPLQYNTVSFRSHLNRLYFYPSLKA